MKNIIDIIQKHSLTVRCLPYEVVSCLTYYEGDENIVSVDGKGNPIYYKNEVIIQDFDLEYFKRTKPSKYNTDTPEIRYKNWKTKYPNGRKLLLKTKKNEHGGWWYVKETKNTDSTVRFSREFDKFFAPTLEEAIKLYLDSIE